MSNTGRSHKRTHKTGSSKSSPDHLAVHSGHSYEGMSGNNSTTSSGATRNTGGRPNGKIRNNQQNFHCSNTDTPLFLGSNGNANQSPALQNYSRRSPRDDPWTPETASYAYSQRPDGTYNGPYNSSSGNSRYNNLYNSSPVNDPYNDPYNNNPYSNYPYNNNSYNSTPSSNSHLGNDYPYNDNPYNSTPSSNSHLGNDYPYNDNPYNSTPSNNNHPVNDSSGVPPYANRNGRIPNGDSNNSRSNNTYSRDYDTMYGRRSNSENNQNNTSSNRARNDSRR